MKKISLVLLAVFGLTACKQTIQLPPSHYDNLANQASIESYPLKADLSTLREEMLFERGVQAYLWGLPSLNVFGMKEGSEKVVWQGLQHPADLQGADERQNADCHIELRCYLCSWLSRPQGRRPACGRSAARFARRPRRLPAASASLRGSD